MNFAALVLTALAAAAPCKGSQLSATFNIIPNSQGAGNVSYALRIRNTSKTACSVKGVPVMHFFSRTGSPLPSHSAWDQRGHATLVTLQPGGYASSGSRFSPDVPGVGEPTNNVCEPTSYIALAQIPPANDAVAAPIGPPTAVCEKGSLGMSYFVAGKKAPYF